VNKPRVVLSFTWWHSGILASLKMLCYAKYTSYYVVFQKETTSSTISWTRTVRLQNFLVHLLSSRSRQRGRLSAQELSICLSVCLFVCMSVAKVQKTRFSQKLSNLELWSLLTTYRQVVHGLFKEPIIESLQSKMAEIRHLENRHDVIIFFCRGWSHLEFRRLVQNDMSTEVMYENGNQM